MKKMMNDKALVRHLAACETMGSATAICSDKTGTLTMNMMTVVNSWVCGKLREPTSLDESFKDDVVKLLFESICLNTNGNVHVDEGCGKPEVTGSPTEVAVLNWGVQLGANFCQVREETKVVEVNSFNSTKKRMGIIAKTSDGKAWVHWKGASEVVLEQCSHFIDVDGTVSILTNDKIEELQGIITSFANAALRTLCLACNEIPPMEFAARTPKKQATDIPDSGLICLAIVGIKDPCRPGVPEAVAKCQQAGIKVRMVTGDNIMTAKAIAIECGILQENGRAIEGKVFREMSVDEQYKCLPSIQVMARSSPTDKYTMVKRLLEMGEIVAVTGDGTNDAPALHEASIGLAMGIAGTEVAKESSDIIIMDDNFSSIVKVVRWGRSVYSNIQKFVQFQTTVNGVALTLNFVAAIVKGSAPLTAVQLLWVNLIMDTMGAVALATEPPNDSLMDRPPIGRREPLITNVMWRNIVGQVIYQLVLLVLFQFDGFALLDLKHSATVLLVEFVGSFTSTVKLSWKNWLLCVGLGAASLPLAAFIKCIPVPETPFVQLVMHWIPKRNVHKKKHEVMLRRGRSVKGMMVGRKSSLTSATKPSKFYDVLDDESTSPASPAIVKDSTYEKSQNCVVRIFQACCPSEPMPTASSYPEIPNRKNSNIAWD
ncbi:hypothetical protein O6H91_23G007900 [Diphasiastrum complanatum]|uniref:Uncharacterized protein n=1 Tax=Diphasiastrum complanatum TaxID=34168 RepID=A0ACC2A7Y5_DIPCM|nr:hypothetical protein O6H91_23G007900 [Diphasiastrum complanatum]